MFATTPSLRDRIDLRKAALVAAIAATAFGVQLAFLGGMVASPLGGAIADLDRIPQVEAAPARALADAGAAGKRRPEFGGVAQVHARPAAVVARHRAPPQDCAAVAVTAE